MSTIVFDLQAAKRGWVFVGKTFQDQHERCDDCTHCAHDGEMGDYDDGDPFDMRSRCRLGQEPGDQPQMCPVYAEHLEEQRELSTTESCST